MISKTKKTFFITPDGVPGQVQTGTNDAGEILWTTGEVPENSRIVSKEDYESAARDRDLNPDKFMTNEEKSKLKAVLSKMELHQVGLQKFADEALELGFSLDAIGALTGKTAKKKEKR